MPVSPAIYADSSAFAEPDAAVARPRVLLVVRWPVGGIKSHLLSNYSSLAEQGFGFTVVGPDDESLEKMRFAFRDVEAASFFGAPVENRRCRLWPVVRALLREERFDVLHSHGVTAAVHAALANLGRGLPHLITLHEPLRTKQFSGWIGPLKRWALARALDQADAVITVSEDSRTNLLDYFPSMRSGADRVLTVPNGIPSSLYAATGVRPTDDLRQKLGLDEQPFLIGFLGRFMPEKGFPLLLEAVGRLARDDSLRPFHLVGFGSGDFRREYQKAILRRGLEKYISLFDAVADVRPVLRQLDLVVVPSLWEASSLISMEAMVMGVPVLGSDCPGLREVLRGTPSRTVTANDAMALTEGLRIALEEPWTESARSYAPDARARFDNVHSVRRLSALLESLANRKQRLAERRAA